MSQYANGNVCVYVQVCVSQHETGVSWTRVRDGDGVRRWWWWGQ